MPSHILRTGFGCGMLNGKGPAGCRYTARRRDSQRDTPVEPRRARVKPGVRHAQGLGTWAGWHGRSSRLRPSHFTPVRTAQHAGPARRPVSWRINRPINRPIIRPINRPCAFGPARAVPPR